MSKFTIAALAVLSSINAQSHYINNTFINSTQSNASNTTHVYQGFNYGSTYNNYTNKYQADFEAEFRLAQSLIGTNGSYNSARLYTMIQAGTTDSPIEAIPAAINTNTTLLLGLWASAGQSAFQLELNALESALQQYNDSLINITAGISVGSEDLYRETPTSIQQDGGPGCQPDQLVQYINSVKSLLSRYNYSDVLVGHVDTYTAWINTTNWNVLNASDFVGMDAYPYYQKTMDNQIALSNATFWDAYNQTVSAVYATGGNQSVWITETGWPVSGPQENAAIASVQNAEYYYQSVACTAFRNNITTYWYTMRDADPILPSPSFGLVNASVPYGHTLYNITCPQ